MIKKNNNYYYHSFKTQLRGQFEAKAQVTGQGSG